MKVVKELGFDQFVRCRGEAAAVVSVMEVSGESTRPGVDSPGRLIRPAD